MKDEDLQKSFEIRLVQARAFREITLLVMKGEADKDPRAFVERMKVIAHRAAEKGA